MINGTKLLNVAGMTRGRRDGILKSEKVRHVVKIGPMHLKGVWYAHHHGSRPTSWESVSNSVTGSPLRELWISPTRRRSPNCCTPCLCTISVRFSTTQPTRTGQHKSCRLQSAASRSSRRRCATHNRRRHSPPCNNKLTTTQWAFRNLLSHPTAGPPSTVLTPSPPLPRVPPV